MIDSHPPSYPYICFKLQNSEMYHLLKILQAETQQKGRTFCLFQVEKTNTINTIMKTTIKEGHQDHN